jgi:hypothetical protein
VFEYRAAAESTAADTDFILDFGAGDRINLIVVDANANAAGNQGFSFIGAEAFGNVAGQLRVTGSGADWLVEGDSKVMWTVTALPIW